MQGTLRRIAAVGVMAAAAALPPLGQQTAIEQRPGSGWVRRDPPRRRRTQADVDAMHLAEAKRARKGAKRLRDAARSHRYAFRWTYPGPGSSWFYHQQGPARFSPGRRRCITRRR